MRVVEKFSQINSSVEISREEHEHCDVCFRAKQTRVPFISSENKANNIFNLIHCDLWGAYREATFCGATCFLTIVVDYSRAMWVYLLKGKMKYLRLLRIF